MKRHIEFIFLIGLAAVFAVVGTAWAQSKSGQSAPKRGCQERFESMDSNHDGKVTREEFMAAPHRRGDPEPVFKATDTQSRGYITMEEFCSGKGMGRGRGMGQGKNQ